MKKSIPHLITAALFLCSTIIGANAQCTINSNTNVSSINPASCNGDIIITNGAVLTINGHTNWSAYAPITIIVENNASYRLGWKFRLGFACRFWNYINYWRKISYDKSM